MRTDIEALRKPFPDDVVEKKTVGRGRNSAEVDFAPWYRYTERLNDAVAENDWEVEVAHAEVVGSELLMVVNVTIEGRTRCGTGSAEADKQSWGGAHSEAFSQAFRRACAQHGLGLPFYFDIPDNPDPTDAPAREDVITEIQRERLKELRDTGHFTKAELDRWSEKMQKAQNKQKVAGVVIREMKETLFERTGEEFQPSEP